jgi:hypothetical protein
MANLFEPATGRGLDLGATATKPTSNVIECGASAGSKVRLRDSNIERLTRGFASGRGHLTPWKAIDHGEWLQQLRGGLRGHRPSDISDGLLAVIRWIPHLQCPNQQEEPLGRARWTAGMRCFALRKGTGS